MKSIWKAGRATAIAALAAVLCAPVAAVEPAAAQASEIRVIVNDQAVTSYDIQRRAAFLRLQQRRGNLQQIALDDMIDQVLRLAEMQRLNIRISEDQVSESYARFARSNNLTPAQLDQILAQNGVTRAHFRDFIRTQMGWGQALGARARAEGQESSQDVVRKMFEQGGERPSATEYMLQQVIFVVPAGQRGARLGARKREAEALRQRFRGCDSTREFARGLIDVTVRDLGRVLAPELPPEWAQPVKSTSAGNATQVRETDRGVEFIGICSAREVSDDRVAQLLFQAEQGTDQAGEELSNKYTAELRERARIVRR